MNFTRKTKEEMMERDGYRCIFVTCRSSQNLTPAHYISRGRGGLGIKENGACVCVSCHQRLDHSTDREEMLQEFKKYLDKKHPGFKDSDRIYKKGRD